MLSTADKTNTYHKSKARLRSEERYSPDSFVHQKIDFVESSKVSDHEGSDMSIENIPNELDPVDVPNMKQ